jgi:hypothetical protein
MDVCDPAVAQNVREQGRVVVLLVTQDGSIPEWQGVRVKSSALKCCGELTTLPSYASRFNTSTFCEKQPLLEITRRICGQVGIETEHSRTLKKFQSEMQRVLPSNATSDVKESCCAFRSLSQTVDLSQPTDSISLPVCISRQLSTTRTRVSSPCVCVPMRTPRAAP